VFLTLAEARQTIEAWRQDKCEARIFEVPVSYFGRSYQEGKKIGGAMASWPGTMLRCV
jgi:hypothetical protein